MNTVDTIIIGGGVTGAAVASSLIEAGRGDILLVERGQPAGGATAQAATLVSLARSQAEAIPYVKETRRQIDAITDGRPEAVGLYVVGAVHASSSSSGAAVLEKTRAVSADQGVHSRVLSPAEVGRRLPWIDASRIALAYWYEDEAYVDGYLLTAAYLAAAKRGGARLMARCAVVAVDAAAGGGYRVTTEQGAFRARNLVVAAGAWSNPLLAALGAAIPFAPVRSQYWITAANPALFPPRQPICILPDAKAYTRPENGSLVFGWREPESVHADPRDLPADVFAHRFADDPDGWENLAGCVDGLESFFPGLEDQGIAHYVAGCSTYTPDGRFNVGEIEGRPGLYAAAGCSGMGIAACGGIGRAIADCIVHGGSDLPLTPFSPNRFGACAVFSEPFMRRCAEARSRKKTG